MQLQNSYVAAVKLLFKYTFSTEQKKKEKKGLSIDVTKFSWHLTFSEEVKKPHSTFTEFCTQHNERQSQKKLFFLWHPNPITRKSCRPHSSPLIVYCARTCLLCKKLFITKIFLFFLSSSKGLLLWFLFSVAESGFSVWVPCPLSKLSAWPIVKDYGWRVKSVGLYWKVGL